MDLRMTWNTHPVNQAHQVLLAKMEPQDRQVKRVIQACLVRKENVVIMAAVERWVQWVYQVPWVSLVPQAIMVLQDCLVKWALLVLPARREKEVIWAQWATQVSKAKKVTKGTRAVAGIQANLAQLLKMVKWTAVSSSKMGKIDGF